MIEAMRGARESIRLESYIFAADETGGNFRAELVAARLRGVSVRVMVDAIGSLFLPADFWKPLSDAGGECKVFNPVSLRRFSIRDHRKMLVCDEAEAIVGGFNVANAYNGDGVTQGWRDLGLQISGDFARELAVAFDEIFAPAEKKERFRWLKRATKQEKLPLKKWELLVGGTGKQGKNLRTMLRREINSARDVKIISAYFLPSWRMRKALARVCGRGGRVQLILAGKSDVRLSQLASHRLYRGLLRGGVEIYEYQPQILHAKLFIVDDVIYAGSANLDTRSLLLNYELLVRVDDQKLAGEARAIFVGDLARSRRIEVQTWRRSRSFVTRWLERLAYFLLVHVDPFLARLQLRASPSRRRQRTTRGTI